MNDSKLPSDDFLMDNIFQDKKLINEMRNYFEREKISLYIQAYCYR